MNIKGEGSKSEKGGDGGKKKRRAQQQNPREQRKSLEAELNQNPKFFSIQEKPER